jgi:hypothetical protein
MSANQKTWTCCICGEQQPVRYMNGKRSRLGMNNPWPLVSEPGQSCCDQCNATKVVPARMTMAR